MSDHILRGMNILRRGLLFLGLACSTCLAQTVDRLRLSTDAETRELVSQAEGLLAGGESQRAYELLMPHEAALAGDVLYDYVLGVAALDTGRLSEAIFSLRRALTVEPGFSGARMELARAYYESGNPELARPLFNQLLGENPPAPVAGVIREYLQAIDRAPVAPQSRFLPYVELVAGYDSNANGSTSDQQFLGFTLSPDNVETESQFAELRAGFDWFVPRSSRFGWIVNAGVSHRANPDASFVDTTIVNGLGGFNWQRAEWFGRAAIDGYWGSRDGNPNESYAGLDALLGRRLNERWDLTLSLRGGAQRYDESIEVLDVDRVMYGLGMTRRFSSRAQLSVQLLGGNDNERQEGSPYGNSKLGGRASLSAPVGDSAWLLASLGTLESDFDGLFFGTPRKDTLFSSVLQLEFRDVLTDGLAIIPRVRYVNNDSDVELYSYDRTELGIAIRWTPQP
ncbi:MAG TPA: tetratricopeptide repeat protein [Woeseiaceae bacterium]|jgi:tetratricopeptide (TPR) repeat protein